MRQKEKKKDDRYRDADEPKQDGHGISPWLVFLISGCSPFREECRCCSKADADSEKSIRAVTV
jgi:hypothetical protein